MHARGTGSFRGASFLRTSSKFILPRGCVRWGGLHLSGQGYRVGRRVPAARPRLFSRWRAGSRPESAAHSSSYGASLGDFGGSFILTTVSTAARSDMRSPDCLRRPRRLRRFASVAQIKMKQQNIQAFWNTVATRFLKRGEGLRRPGLVYSYQRKSVPKRGAVPTAPVLVR
jgi:hypothetical protein